VPWRRWLSQRKRYLSHALAVSLGGGGLGGAGGGFLVLPGGPGAGGGPGGVVLAVLPGGLPAGGGWCWAIG
jgi:hypothetical protein